jgi:N-acetylglucosaminyl-diphospho-decaprenol L-rhamnosyltransferase
MKECIDAQREAGIVGCRHLNSDGSMQTAAIQSFPTILNQTLDADLLRRCFPRSRLWGTAALFSGSTDPLPVDMVSGACLMIRRDVFEQIGGFSVDYFMYSEDVDICYKVHLSGWKAYYLPTASIIHYHGQSTRKKPTYFPQLMQQESKFIYFSKMRGSLYAHCFRASRFFIAVIRMAMIGLLLLGPYSPDRRLHLRFSMGKWLSILRWAVGLQRPPDSKTRTQGAPVSS